MKKQIFSLITAFWLFVAIAVTLVGCGRANDEKGFKFSDGYIYVGESYSDYAGITARIKNIESNGTDTYMEVEWNNETKHETMYGEFYGIEREIDGEWKSCLKNSNLSYNDVGYLLLASRKQEKGYNITDSFDISEEGKYRFRSYLFVYENGRGAKSIWCNVYAEFNVVK